MSTAAREATTEEHSDLVGGSSAGKRIMCPGSYQQEQKIPEDIRKGESSAYADEGTALHEAMAYILHNDITLDELDEQIVGMEFYGHQMTRQLVAEAIVPAVQFFDKLIDKLEAAGEDDFQFVVEKRCQMPGIPGAFGTSDLIGRTSKRSIILDWKFGAGVPVSAFMKVDESYPGPAFERDMEVDGQKVTELHAGNPQLLFYARAAMHTHPELFEKHSDWPVELFIVQPRIVNGRGENHSRWTADVQELEDFRMLLIRRISEATGDNPTIQKGPHCRFAVCKTVCPKWIGAQLDLTKALVKNDLAAAEQLAEHSEDGRERYEQLLGLILDLGEINDALYNEAQRQAHLYLEQGGSLGDYGLYPKKAGARSWVDEEKAEKWLARKGLDLHGRREVKVISPAKAETLLNAAGIGITEKEREKYIAPGVSSGSKVARKNPLLDEVKSTPGMIAELAAKLQALSGA